MSLYAESVNMRRSERLRTLTPQAKAEYDTKVERFCRILTEIKADMRQCIGEIEHADVRLLPGLRDFITKSMYAYERESDKFLEYLRLIRTIDSMNEIESQLLAREALGIQVRTATEHIELRSPSPKSFKGSYKSLSQHTSSSLESILQQKEAKIEAKRIMMEHLEEECSRARQDMKMAERELTDLREETCRKEIAPSESSRYRTLEYVRTLPGYRPSETIYPDRVSQGECSVPHNTGREPLSHRASLNHDVQIVDLFTKHLVKRDLVMSRLTKFDDDPMMYVSWKLGFLGIMDELEASDTEMLELLCEKLGPDSSRQARTIRACNARSPATAIEKIWDKLERRFGAAEQVEKYINKKIKDFPVISTDKYHLLYDLVDLASEISSLKSQPQFEVLFSYFDSKKGVNELVEKLPWNLKDKWTTEATRYKRNFAVVYPPFPVFLRFLEDMAEMKNDPAFQFEKKSDQRQQGRQSHAKSPKQSAHGHTTFTTVTARKTEAITSPESCPLHKNSAHLLNDCKVFRQKSIGERKKLVLSNGICFKCCSGAKHRAKNCKADVKCSVCHATSHPTALHEDTKTESGHRSNASHNTGVETYEGENQVDRSVITACTKVSGVSTSCAKIVPVRVYHLANPSKPMLIYATIDDQSNRSLATSSFFDHFGLNSGDVPYTLVSCGGSVTATGRTATGFTVESLDGTCRLSLPELIECNELPNNRDEIPSREIATRYPHLASIATEMSPLIQFADINLLIGRDLISAHVVHEQIVGEENQPFAQRLPLGWVVVGQVCLGGAHVPEVRTFKTFVLGNGRPSQSELCPNEIAIRGDLFHKTEHDEKVGLSIEDREFLDIMDSSFKRDQEGYWVAPLPFKPKRLPLPNNKSQALRRAKSFDASLRYNFTKLEHVKEFMRKLFDRGHAEKASELDGLSERWYLPMFGVYHPKKPESIRVVFDSSARHEGISLNDSLLKGPDLSNSLQGVLMRFRQEQYAVMADIEQMFHNFRVREDHRNYLRFLWHPDHDLQLPLEEYRMTVHVFGNSPSPSVATYGLRKAVSSADQDVRDFVSQNFYVDDGLTSFSEIPQGVDLIKRTQQALIEGGRLRLHKIASNSVEILHQFPKEELAKDLLNLDIGNEALPDQRSLGLSWSIETDTFTFKVNQEPKPFTRRGVLSVINSLFDPIGFTAPVTIEGKVILREAMSSKCDWDEPLPENLRHKWEQWVESLLALERLHIPRMYCPLSVEKASSTEVHIFSDASKEAVAAVAFIKVSHNEQEEVGFLIGKAKVAPSHGHTIPRLELCASVLAIDIAEIIREQLHLPKEKFTFYTDSQVVLGYISNDSKRFHVYVANRVSRIRSFL